MKKIAFLLSLLILSQQILATTIHVNVKNMNSTVCASYELYVKYDKSTETKKFEYFNRLDFAYSFQYNIKSVSKILEISIFKILKSENLPRKHITTCTGKKTIDDKSIIGIVVVEVSMNDNKKIKCQITAIEPIEDSTKG